MNGRVALQSILVMVALTLDTWVWASAQVNKAVVPLPQMVSGEHVPHARNVLLRLPFVAKVVPSPTLEETLPDPMSHHFWGTPPNERYFEVAAAAGQSINYAQMVQALRKAGFISSWVQLTVSGALGAQQDKIILTAAVGGEKFVLEEYRCKDKSGPTSPKRSLGPKQAQSLRELLSAASSGKQVKSVTGCVIPSKTKQGEPLTLGVMGFEMEGK